MGKRKCEKCGVSLTEDDVIKVKVGDGSWEIIPLPTCPSCFKEQMRQLAHARQKEPKIP